MKINNISIVIPILNEEKNLEQLVKKIVRIKDKIQILKFELIFVDDNSKDKTQKILNKLKKKYPYIRYFIRKNKKKDLSQSCMLGFNKSIFENIIVMDGDLQHKPSCLKKMIKMYSKNQPDILVGTRNFSNNSSLGFLRKNLSRTIIFVINNLLFEKKTNDPMSGFFIFKKEIFLKSKHKLYNSGFKILFDIVYSFKNIKVLDCPINFGVRKFHKSKLNFTIAIKIMYLIYYKFFQSKLVS